MRVIVLTVLAMLAFAANSVLARLALSSGAIDAAAFTGVRLASGALVLGLLLWLRAGGPAVLTRLTGSWAQSAALFGYAICFSLAYNLLGASMGALILFASVQIGMVTRAVWAGDRPAPLEWVGLLAAAGAFIYLVSPGLAAPHPLGAALMIVAGLCWAGYSPAAFRYSGQFHPLLASGCLAGDRGGGDGDPSARWAAAGHGVGGAGFGPWLCHMVCGIAAP
jgi:drug/metabolite transporter (DMT)-like permease